MRVRACGARARDLWRRRLAWSCPRPCPAACASCLPAPPSWTPSCRRAWWPSSPFFYPTLSSSGPGTGERLGVVCPLACSCPALLVLPKACDSLAFALRARCSRGARHAARALLPKACDSPPRARLCPVSALLMGRTACSSSPACHCSVQKRQASRDVRRRRLTRVACHALRPVLRGLLDTPAGC